MRERESYRAGSEREIIGRRKEIWIVRERGRNRKRGREILGESVTWIDRERERERERDRGGVEREREGKREE